MQADMAYTQWPTKPNWQKLDIIFIRILLLVQGKFMILPTGHYIGF